MEDENIIEVIPFAVVDFIDDYVWSCNRTRKGAEMAEMWNTRRGAESTIIRENYEVPRWQLRCTPLQD